ncbi:hypothetical protein ACX9QF_001347, partial [Citrobacter freundii]
LAGSLILEYGFTEKTKKRSWGQMQHYHGNQYARGKITLVLAVVTGGNILSILAFNRLNGTVKAFLSERLMMKDDMLVTLSSAPATVHHAL